MKKIVLDCITKIGFTGVWLFFLYCFLVTLVIGALGSYSFNKALDDAQFNELPLSIKILDEASKKQANLKQLINDLKNDLTKENKHKTNISSKSSKEDDKLAKLEKEENSDSTKEIKIIRAHVKKFNLDIESSDRKIKQITSDLSKYRSEIDDFGIIENFIYDYNFFSMYKGLYRMPLGLLTLVLTMSMGALGSLIFITLEYFKEETKKKLSWYFFRPFLGIVTAIAVFVFAKAGQLTISDQGISENLNPFFLSFLGIISGLVSEHATDKLRATGATVFQSDVEKEKSLARWAVTIDEQMKAQTKSIEQLSSFIDAPAEILNDWISEKKPVPENEQKIIAAWLNVSRRRLFTDIAPQESLKK